jgi:two-component system phosphate regulon sensor histidine kinase PhoR
LLDVDEFRSLLYRLPGGVVAINQNLTVLFANPAAGGLFGELPRSGKPLPDVAGDFDVSAFGRSLFTRNAGPGPTQVEVDGKIFEVRGIPAYRRRFAALVIEDVSGRTRGDRARAEFVANAAHELLTPLTGIASAAHVLESGAKEDPEMRDRFLDHIARECNRLTRIAHGLLVLARSQSGEEPPRPELVDLRSLLDDILEASPNGVTVDVACGAGVDVFVDRDLAEVALSNLIGNALRHSSERAVSVAVDETAARTVQVLIADPGGAIGGDFVRLRRRFVSGGGRDGGGFGLGMSIASQAVETIGGTLEYAADNGSMRVRVELPGVGEPSDRTHPPR